MQRALASSLPPKALAALNGFKTADEKAPEVTAPGTATTTPTSDKPEKEKPEVKTEGEGDSEVILLTPPSPEGNVEGEGEGEAAPEDLTLVKPEELKKRLEAKNKENTKIRKRAQEAQASVKTLTEELERTKQELAARQSSAIPSSNPLAVVTDAKVLDALQADVQKVRGVLTALAKDPEAPAEYISSTDGQKYEITPEWMDWVLSMSEHIPAQRKALEDLKTAESAASEVQKLFHKTPAYQTALKAVQGLDYFTQRPLLEADAAIGRMAREGGYQLVKIDKGKAAGATSPAAPSAERPAAAAAAAAPTPSVPGVMPPVARSGEEGRAESSAALDRAKKTGSQVDIRASIAAKTKRRTA